MIPRVARKLLTFSWHGLLGVILTLLVVFIVYLNSRSDLEVWHTADLDREFTASSELQSFDDYLALEKGLFQQLDERVYAVTPPGGDHDINRYRRGSQSDPARWPVNWNRSYLLESEDPHALVLLLHGLSDSPYSLRQLGRRLHAQGATVLGLRVPGHGTAPSGLVDVRWEDMAAAVRLAMQHLDDVGSGRPIHIVGYSNGAALAVQYALAALENDDWPRAERLVLLSPQIGVTRLAAFAVWQARLGHLLGMDKLAWNEILIEYDPFKYGSFAVNAGDVSHRITREIRTRLDELGRGGRLSRMPPILAFSSVVDATVEVPALVSHLFNRLPSGKHELVLFDINRQAGMEHILRWKPDRVIDALRETPDRNYRLTLVTNAHAETRQVVERTLSAGASRADDDRLLGLEWPPQVYSLSHVALPFAPDDPLYGGGPDGSSPGIRLGNLALRGERGALAISDSALLRLRWNPFYSWMEDRAVRFLDLDPPD